MSLYYETANFTITNDGIPSSRIYGTRGLKSKPAHIVALLSETSKWSTILSSVVENAGILALERKLTPSLALLLTHDLLLSKNGVAAPRDHILRTTIEKHKARLSAEFTKARIKSGFATVQAWRDAIGHDALESVLGDGNANGGRESAVLQHPRWIRINTLKTTLDTELATTFADFTRVPLSAIVQPSSASSTQHNKTLAIDIHIPNLIAIPPVLTSSITSSPSYRSGRLIFQDKASCFSAYLLDPRADDGDFVDACAAPGNKTTHLAALLCEAAGTGTTDDEEEEEARERKRQVVYACERDPIRSSTLQKMVRLAGAGGSSLTTSSTTFKSTLKPKPTKQRPNTPASNEIVHILPSQDFLRLSPTDPRFRNVGALLLDPSCSGSGIVGRDDGEDDGATTSSGPRGALIPHLTLPRTASEIATQATDRSRNTKKRKRSALPAPTAPPSSTPGPSPLLKPPSKPHQSPSSPPSSPNTNTNAQKTSLQTRLTSLSNFQLTLLTHALSFPSANRIIYSTCSVHTLENEVVVLRALTSPVAKRRGWRVLRREEQVEGMGRWSVRGVVVGRDREGGEGKEGGGDGDGGNGTETWTRELAEEVASACIRCEKGTEEGTMGFFVAGFVRDGLGDRDGDGGANSEADLLNDQVKVNWFEGVEIAHQDDDGEEEDKVMQVANSDSDDDDDEASDPDDEFTGFDD